MSNTLIQAQQLHKHYAGTHAVNNVSIELCRGDILGLLGANGAGKSTCMQMLCGALAPSAGEIQIEGIDLLDKPRQAKQKIGYLPDKPPLYPELTVDEYLVYAAQLRRVAKSDAKDYLQLAKQRCGLQQHSKRLIAHLSKGFQQRLGIAQAIIHQPSVIILDEPTSGLDPIQIREIRTLIKELGEHHGIILSTHILPEVQAVCSRVQMIHQGKSVINRPIEQLQNNNIIKLRLQQAPSRQDISKLPNVSDVQQSGPNEFILQLNIQTDTSTLDQAMVNISQHCVDQQWGLLELHQQQNSLEQLFFKLTANDDIQSNDIDKEDTQESAA